MAWGRPGLDVGDGGHQTGSTLHARAGDRGVFVEGEKLPAATHALSSLDVPLAFDSADHPCSPASVARIVAEHEAGSSMEAIARRLNTDGVVPTAHGGRQ